MIDRIALLRAELKKYSADILAVFNPADIFYLTGVRTSEGMILIRKEETAIYVPFVNYSQAELTVPKGIECRTYNYVLPTKDFKDKQVLFDFRGIDYITYLKIKETAKDVNIVDGLVSRFRIIKDNGEIKLLKTAASTAAKIVESLNIDEWVGKKESRLAAYLQEKSWGDGCSGCAFTPVVAAGKNSAHPHHIPSEDYIKSGWLKVDYGVEYNGYCSDLTRTFILSKFNNGLNSEELFLNLKVVKDKVVKELKPGVKCSEIYNIAKQALKDYSLDKYFIHNLGHGIGIEVHEKPSLNHHNSTRLEAGMVITIEPGFYIPGVGGMRMEDTYLITEEGSKLLTRKFQ